MVCRWGCLSAAGRWDQIGEQGEGRLGGRKCLEQEDLRNYIGWGSCLNKHCESPDWGGVSGCVLPKAALLSVTELAGGVEGRPEGVKAQDG